MQVLRRPIETTRLIRTWAIVNLWNAVSMLQLSKADLDADNTRNRAYLISQLQEYLVWDQGDGLRQIPPGLTLGR